MLDNIGLERWFDKNNLSVQARQQINRIRTSDPSRLVKSGRKNISGRYPSSKMGRVIQFESHKNELITIYDYESDNTVLEYWDQPPPFKINFLSAAGKNMGIFHTADFFVMYENGAGWEECKLEQDLKALAEKYQDRYVQECDGTWRCPPGEKHAAEFGLSYRVKTMSETNWVKVRNFVFLEDYLASDQQISESSRNVINRIVLSHPGISLFDLLEQSALDNADDLYLMILHMEVYVDLHAEPLGEPERVHVFPDRLTAEALHLITARMNVPAGEPQKVSVDVGSTIVWDGSNFSIKHIGVDNVWLTNPQNDMVKVNCNNFEELVKDGTIRPLSNNNNKTENISSEIMLKASLKDLEIAHSRLQKIAPIMDGKIASGNITRSEYRWIESYRKSLLIHGDGFLGLIPSNSSKGNRVQRMPETRIVAKKIIEEQYMTHQQPNIKSIYNLFAKECIELGLPLLSYEGFCKYVSQIPEYDKLKARMGKRAAYNHEPFYVELEYSTPRHGERPFEIGHIDHTELDLELVDSKTRKNLGRPWLTFMLDAFSRRILAYTLTFESPSYKSVLMIMRECVRRHGRLPQILVLDGGKEFHGTNMEILCSRYNITKKKRRPAKGRDGSVLERIFGTANTQVINNLEGNTQITKHVRIMTKTFDPKRHALWTLERFNLYFSIWAYEIYDNNEHPALGESPMEAYMKGIATGGKRLSRLISYDESFVIMTLPICKEKGSKVHVGKGVIVNGINYCQAPGLFSSACAKFIFQFSDQRVSC